VILGAGFGGLSSANLLRKSLSDEHRITVIDRKDHFIMGFVNLWILHGTRNFVESKTALSNLKSKGISFLQDNITEINPIEKSVTTAAQGAKHEYDYLIVALGAEYTPEKIDGFAKNGGFNLYDAEQIPKLRKEILALKQGKIAICITSLPYKCPPGKNGTFCGAACSASGRFLRCDFGAAQMLAQIVQASAHAAVDEAVAHAHDKAT
jgi:sulfide:quinone oxidoreductase